MKLITGLILTLVLLTGCSKTETAPEEFLYTAMYSRTADEITTPGIFHIEAGEFFTEVSVSTAGRPNQVVFTDYTPDGSPVSSASFPLPEDAMQIPHAYLGERGVYLIHKGGFESDPYYLSLYDREGNPVNSVPLEDVKPGMWVRFEDEKWDISTLGVYGFSHNYLGLKASIAKGVRG